MAFIHSWLDAAYLCLERLKGKAVVIEHQRYGELGEHLTAIAVAGYEIRVYCQKTDYVREYAATLFFKRTHCVFRVFGVPSCDAPVALKKACELDLHLPCLTPWFVSEFVQKEIVVQAYLDVLIARINEQKALQPAC